LNIKWILRRPVRYWIDQDVLTGLAPAFVQEVLDGPFHGARRCNERLAQRGASYSSSPMLEEQCPGCGVDVFHMRNNLLEDRMAASWTVRAQALSELQRMHRNGCAFDAHEVELERPQYWQTMLPVR
jgi:hypothetical protein